MNEPTRYTQKQIDVLAREAARDYMNSHHPGGKAYRVRWTLVITSRGTNDETSLEVNFDDGEKDITTHVAI